LSIRLSAAASQNILDCTRCNCNALKAWDISGPPQRPACICRYVPDGSPPLSTDLRLPNPRGNLRIRRSRTLLGAEYPAPSGAPTRTTEMAHRDKRTNWLKSPLNRPVSGSESKDLNRQHPANSRAFPDPSYDPGGKSLHPQPGWRWGESRGNSSLGVGIPVKQGKYRESLPNLMLLAEPKPSFASVSEAVATNSL